MSRILGCMLAGWLTLIVSLSLPSPVWADWASAQSSRGVRAEPNDFWYWHKIGPSGEHAPPLVPTDIIYDPDHTYLWDYGDNYLNLPRAWAISKAGDLENSVILAVTDTEFMVDHFDLQGNVYKNKAELLGNPNVDDDGNGYIDDILPPKVNSFSGTLFGSASWDRRLVISGVDFEPQEGQHGTNMSSQYAAMTNNDSWWVGRDYDDYIQDIVFENAGIPGISWNGRLLPQTPHGENVRFLDLIEELVGRGENIRVVSCSWLGRKSQWVQRLSAMGILVIASSDNINWKVNDLGADQPCLSIGGVEYGTYRRSRIQGVEDAISYRVNDYGVKLDCVGYTPYGGGWFDWGNGKYVSATGNSQIWTLGWIETTGYAKYDDMSLGKRALVGLLGIPEIDYKEPLNKYGFRNTPVMMPSELRSSGDSPQAAGVAALLFTKHPELTPEQAIGAIRRGCVNVDAYNTDTCCLDPDKENCFNWTDGKDGWPLDGVMQDGGFSGSGEIDSRIEGDSCAGLLGAGRLDAYRTLTLWGLIDADTTLSGDIYVSGDVMIAGATVTVEPGTVFHIAPDDITYLDPWDPEDRYDMSDAGPGDNYGYSDHQTAPFGAIQFIFYDAPATMVINGTANDPVVFDSFVNDAQTEDDWVGIDIFDSGSILKPNGASSMQIMHSTKGEF